MVQIGPFDVELVPKTSWGKKVSNILGEKEWQKIRKRELKRVSYKCEVCSYKGEPRELVCHEMWEYDDANFVQKLVGYRIVCRKCNLIYHLGYAATKGLANEAIEHFSKLTGLGIEEARSLLNSKYRDLIETHKERSKHEWKIDVSFEKSRVTQESSRVS